MRTMGNKKTAAGCQIAEPDLSSQRPTVRQAAERLVQALDRLDAGTDDLAESEVAEARHELRVLLAATPAAARNLTGADFDPDAFQAIWTSTAVQNAGRNYGWRGIAEAVWAAALDEARGVSAS